MNPLPIILYTAGFLTLLTAVLMIFAITLRLITARRIRREIEFRKTAQPLLKLFLAGDVSAENTASVLHKDLRSALQFLMETSDSMNGEERKKLLPLFDTLPFVKKELAALKSRDWQVRLHAVHRLGYVGDDFVLTPLMMALRDDVIAVRFAAAQSLVRLGSRNAVEPIVSALSLPAEISQRRVAEILVGLKEMAIDPIRGILKNPSSNDASLSIAARVAGMLHAGRALPFLQKLLHHPNPNVRLNSVRAMASIGNNSSVLPISELGCDDAWEVRSTVMTALGKLKACEHIPLLLKGLSDMEWWVRYNAAQALPHLGDEGIKAIEMAVNYHFDSYGRDMSRQTLQRHSILKFAGEAH